MENRPQTIVTRRPSGRLHYDFVQYIGQVPSEFIGALERYFNEGIAPGSGTMAVLENDFKTAIRNFGGGLNRFSSWPISTLNDLLDMLLEGAPSDAWGSPQKVQSWLSGFREELSREEIMEEVSRRG